MKSFTKRAALVSAATILLGIIPIHAMDEVTAYDDFRSQEVAPQTRFYPKKSRNNTMMNQTRASRQTTRGRHGTGSRKKIKQNMPEQNMYNNNMSSKFGTEESDSASESPEGTSEGESN